MNSEIERRATILVYTRYKIKTMMDLKKKLCEILHLIFNFSLFLKENSEAPLGMCQVAPSE